MRLSLLLLLCSPIALPAQVVRGIVRDSASGEPASGVLVALVQRSSGIRRTVLTDEAGRFTVGAPGPGSYALETKRIGVRPQLTPEFALAGGEAREVSLTVAPVVARLEPVRVTGRSYCGERVTQGAETATLWEEVRAALTAARLSNETGRSPVTITSFRRTLDPVTFEVRAEQRTERHGMTSNPFWSAALASLSAHGYIVSDGDSLEYRAPGVDVLLSDLFVRDHCFRTVLETTGGSELLGLSFEPTSARRVPDIVGVLWIDARTHELRRLEYRYTRSPIEVSGPQPLSYVDFARMPSGAWIVQRWAIRMPQVTRLGPKDAPSNPLSLGALPSNRLVAVIEEGGEAVVGVRRASAATPTVEGTVFDSTTGRPLGGARVSLRGTPFNATADAAGRYRIQLPDTGSYMLVFDHPRLDSLNFDVPARNVRVAGTMTGVDVAVPPLETVRSALCPGSGSAKENGIVHGTVRNTSGAPMAWATLKAHLVIAAAPQAPSLAGVSASAAAPGSGTSFVADSRGRYVLCDVPRGRYRFTIESETGIAETEVLIDAGQMVMRDLSLRSR
jgi:hypothetical protein